MDIESIVVPTVTSAVTMVNNLNSTIKDSHKSIKKYETLQTSYTAYEYGGVLALFAISILLILLGWCGIGAGEQSMSALAFKRHSMSMSTSGSYSASLKSFQ